MSEMDDFDKKMIMRLPNTEEDSDDSDKDDFWH